MSYLEFTVLLYLIISYIEQPDIHNEQEQQAYQAFAEAFSQFHPRQT